MDNKLKVRSMAELGAIFGDEPDEVKGGDSILDLPAEQLVPFKDHPFKPYSEEKTAAMVESVKEQGILEPILVRAIPDSNNYEIIAGHNRVMCAKLAGLKTVPSIIKDVDDNTATFMMIESNLQQREKILPSERAAAYKLQYDILESMGKKAVAEEIGESEGLTKRSVYKYIRLNYLNVELLDMVDDEALTFKVGVDLSYLTAEEQDELLAFIVEQKIKLSEKQAERLKAMSQNGKWDLNKFCELDSQKPKPLNTVSLKGKKLERFFPKSTPKKEIENLIFTLLEQHFANNE